MNVRSSQALGVLEAAKKNHQAGTAAYVLNGKELENWLAIKGWFSMSRAMLCGRTFCWIARPCSSARYNNLLF
jgi:hypothetical protein